MSLKNKKLVTPVPGRGAYKVTPMGKEAVAEKMSGPDLVTLVAEGATANAPVLGQTQTALVPDFVGMIYKSVDLSDEAAVRTLIPSWLKDDLRIGKI